VGGGIWSALAHYLAQPAPRMLLGFNPRIQLLHPDDAAAAFALAVHSSATGALNLAAADPLTLKQAVRLTGKQPVNVPEPLLHVASWAGLRGSLPGGWPFERSFLRYACVADTRRAQAVLGWQPRHSSKACLRDLAAHQPAGTSASPARVERVWG
jgi:UDP-glucose 4-epimerase